LALLVFIACATISSVHSRPTLLAAPNLERLAAFILLLRLCRLIWLEGDFFGAAFKS
jgi:hypothetical protein